MNVSVNSTLTPDMSVNSMLTPDHCNTTNPVTYKILSWLMIGEFALALPLNLTVLYIFLFRFKFWKTNSVFLFNIVVADFLLVVCLPVKAYNFMNGRRRCGNKLACQTMLTLLFLNRGASIAFLTVLSLDRYFKVVHLGRGNFIRRKAPQISILIWLLLLPLTIPTMLKNFDCCNSLGRTDDTKEFTDAFREVVFFTQILVPFFILSYCTVRIVHRLRRKTVGDKTKLKRAVWLVISVVLVFSVCFLPCQLSRVALLYVRLKDWQKVENVVVQVYDAFMVLSYIDCLLDPLVYCFCYSGFKDAYLATFCPTAIRRRLSVDLFSASGTSGTGTTATSATRRQSLVISPANMLMMDFKDGVKSKTCFSHF